jgi:ribonucleotide reductase beta subunit family protein with ferritin-like domain
VSGLTEESKVYKPFQYEWAAELALEHEKIHWGEWECSLQDDVNQWNTGVITPEEKSHITQILRLFTQSDAQVANNYCSLFIPKFKNNEIRHMLLSFANREVIHQRAYALLNDTLGFHETEYSKFLEFKEMKNKIEFMQDNDTSTHSGTARALAQTCVNEGMSLFSAFIMLLNYQRFGKLRGTSEIVEWSIRDETAHLEGMTHLFKAFCQEHPKIVNDEFKQSIYEMFRVAVKLEDAVIDLAFSGGEIEGLTAKEVKQYIRWIANRRLIQLGLKKNWKVKENPIPWLDYILSGDSVKNFFEGKVTDYSATSMAGEWGW